MNGSVVWLTIDEKGWLVERFDLSAGKVVERVRLPAGRAKVMDFPELLSQSGHVMVKAEMDYGRTGYTQIFRLVTPSQTPAAPRR